MALSEEQAQQACDRYERMLAALEGLAAQHDAVFASRSPEFFPGPTWITTRVRSRLGTSLSMLARRMVAKGARW